MLFISDSPGMLDHVIENIIRLDSWGNIHVVINKFG